MDNYIDETYDEIRQRKEWPEKFIGKPERTDLLWDVAQKAPDKKLLRDQLTAVWVPSNETTSIHIANTLWHFARSPQAWKRHQEEVTALGDEDLTFSKLRGMKYMKESEQSPSTLPT
ncbi:hypothetical protein QBC36DRAFT_308124 [Triangularia setosa]|uniref:Uncharacterized protein n=1 Tax=Triangularia setosa TaxID=2587417 RepID=A0AAN6WD53_9PEZI|nr:hypothetical protein QBC36DRAFT_308124 [Podospora setosa]